MAKKKVRAVANRKPLLWVVGFATVALFILAITRAAGVTVSFQAESAPTKTGAAQSVADNGASGGSALQFNSSSTGGGIGTYQGNLARLLAATYRNRTEDNSPYLNTPSAQLNPNNHYGPWADHNNYQISHDDPPHQGKNIRAGEFRTMCEFSHFSYDDPIVYPNTPEKAHLHMYFGNTHVNAFTTYEKLLNSGGSTCNGTELNRTGYWAPAMIDGSGNVRIPHKILVYYKAFNAAIGKTISYPANLQIISKGEANEQEGQIATEQKLSFMCNDIYNGARNNWSFVIPACTATSTSGDPAVLEMNVKFQQCWNGLDPTNYKDNLRLPLNHWYSGVCPSTHPMIFPNLEYRIFYPIQGTDNTSNWFLSSDVDPVNYAIRQPRGDTYHGDWWGAWHKPTNDLWVKNCNNVYADCLTGQLHPSGTPTLKLRRQYIPVGATTDNVLNASYKAPLQTVYNQVCSVPKTLTSPAQGAYCRP